MKRERFLIISICLVLYSCSCIPTSTELTGTYTLDYVQYEGEKVNYADSLYSLTIGLIELNQIMVNSESSIINGDTLSIAEWAEVQNPDECKKDG